VCLPVKFHVALQYSLIFRTEKFLEYFNLSQNNALESLYIDDLATFGDYDDEEIGCHIPVLLTQITSLQELTIEFSDTLVIESNIWNTIDRQADRLNLQRFNIGLSWNISGKLKEIECVKEHLPLCVARGILRFC
jgi:hypothetical protein